VVAENDRSDTTTRTESSDGKIHYYVCKDKIITPYHNAVAAKPIECHLNISCNDRPGIRLDDPNVDEARKLLCTPRVVGTEKTLCSEMD